MDQSTIWAPQSDWHSPTRLHIDPINYDFPGDRFIPNRSLMDLDRAHSLLTSKSNKEDMSKPKFSREYSRKLKENLTLDCEGRPFQMLVFRGSPKSSRKSALLIDEMRHSDEKLHNFSNSPKQHRRFPKSETKILDASMLKDDFYMNIMDWGKTNILAVALGAELYLWNAANSNVQKLLPINQEDNYITSVAWSDDAKTVAVGCLGSQIQLWDAETCKLVRNLKGHRKRVGSTSWSGHILTSGSRDKSIINHDVRAKSSVTFRIQAHSNEVCGLKWSSTGSKLASGGNDNIVYIWETLKMSSSHFLHRFNDHGAAVKALAWCPYDSDVLASGGGTADGCIKIWNTQKGKCINSIDTNAQICGLEWNKHHKEILSGHGFSRNEHNNQLRLWRYPSMSNIGEFKRQYSSRVLHLAQSPDGLTVVSAGADETLRFWEIFGPPKANSLRISELDSLLSLKTSPIR